MSQGSNTKVCVCFQQQELLRGHHIPITLHVEMSQQICRTKGAHCLLLTEASWNLTTSSSLQMQDELPGPHWDHPELQLLSAVTVPPFKPCPVPAQMPEGHILEAVSGESSSPGSASSLTFRKQKELLTENLNEDEVLLEQKYIYCLQTTNVNCVYEAKPEINNSTFAKSPRKGKPCCSRHSVLSSTNHSEASLPIHSVFPNQLLAQSLQSRLTLGVSDRDFLQSHYQSNYVLI